MKLERINEYVSVVLVTTFGALLAIYCGKSVGNAQINLAIMLVGASVAALICIRMHANIWILLPIFWSLYGQISVIPLPFSARELVSLFVFVVVMVLKALKVFKEKPVLNRLDLLMIINLLYLVSVYIRNPTGFNALGADRVGGKPYFFVLVSVLAYWCLIRMRVTPSQARRLPLWIFSVVCIVTILSLIAICFPGAGALMSHFYSGIGASSDMALSAYVGGGEQTNVHGLECFRDFSRCGMVTLCSYFRPLTLLFPVFYGRFLGFIICVVATFAAGYRSSTVFAAIMFTMGTYFRKGWQETLAACAAAGLLVVFLILGQGQIFDLPLSTQRALSYLPGEWNYQAREDAEGSTEWRVDMWKEVLDSDKYIQNKIFGDGYGMSLQQYRSIMATISSTGFRTSEDGQLNAMIAGDYHSGPLSTLHNVGAVGVVLFYALMIWMAVVAARLIRKAKNTPYLPLALFLGMPIVAEPLYYTFIFGGFDNALGMAVFNTGMLRLLERSLETPVGSPAVEAKPERFWLDLKHPSVANARLDMHLPR